ncbi:MAG: hypothetical protein M5U01_30415 [Ardenticatenaceae bacterium]|nr:hypothetical protein [Ardenticatenaceae bacterium]
MDRGLDATGRQGTVVGAKLIQHARIPTILWGETVYGFMGLKPETPVWVVLVHAPSDVIAEQIPFVSEMSQEDQVNQWGVMTLWDVYGNNQGIRTVTLEGLPAVQAAFASINSQHARFDQLLTAEERAPMPTVPVVTPRAGIVLPPAHATPPEIHVVP